ncbi:MAG: bifunctional serine/threonine-protein kinase/formylglycine-generating enzyme family protein [Planctomycetota bacterium]|jgi:serine/threonine protein kinase/formylglycine-generating enzyme required for sulfatase activity
MNERELFLSALEIEDPAARQAHLESACADDADLQARVESLLASHESQSQFLNIPVVEQIRDDSARGSDATILPGDSSTHDEESDAATSGSNGPEPKSENRNDLPDETPLAYLQPSSRPDSLGRLAHYEILEVIGTGAFGTVLKAFDEKLQRVVAIKVLSPEMAATSPARKRFLREARSSAAVRHENVVSIYAVEDDPIPYLVMDYIPGQTLQQRLDEHGPLDLPDVLRLGKQIADGLAAAHAQQLIHRDVKPGNILLETSLDDHVKITDFGLARAADDASVTQSGMIAGTPLYMAPEQALGQKLDQRADLFSFGSVLYQMLSGRPPFRAPTTVAVLKRVAEDKPRPIREIIPEVPCWMCQLIGHLHAKNPDHRYSTAKEVSNLLAQCLADVQAGRRPRIPAPSWPPEGPACCKESEKVRLRGIRRISQRPLAAAAAVVLLLIVGLGITEATGVTKLASTVIQVITGAKWVRVDRSPLAADSFQWPADAPPPAIAPFDADQAKQHQQAWADYLGVPVEKEIVIGQDKDGKDVKLTMVLIPPGEFLMGSSAEDQARFSEEAKADNLNEKDLVWFDRECPQHLVRITKPFWLSRHECTNRQFSSFVEATGYKTEAEFNGQGGFTWDAGGLKRDPSVSWSTFKPGQEDKPVVNVTWNDTKACCAWLSELQTDSSFSLPTEAQWEYACRAGTTTPWYAADQTELDQYGWLGKELGTTHPVGQLRPNAFGLYDMHGNVWEWCADWFHEYSDSVADDPIGRETGICKMIRGGNVYHRPGDSNKPGDFNNLSRCRSAARCRVPATHCMFDRGFRVAAALPENLIRAKVVPESSPETELSSESAK